jgi:hypothetical protein
VILVKNGKKHLIFIAEKSQGKRRKCASPLRIFQKKSPTENSWAFYVWWWNADHGSNPHLQRVRNDSGVCPLFAEFDHFTK